MEIALGKQVLLTVKRSKGFFNLKRCTVTEFEECGTCEAPLRSIDVQCPECCNVKKLKIHSKGKIISNEMETFEFGPGQKIKIKEGERICLTTVFSSSPLFAHAQKLREGERVKIKGWGEVYDEQFVDANTIIAKLYVLKSKRECIKK